MTNYPTKFKRKEIKFQCNYTTAKIIEKRLEKILIREKFEGKKETRIYNLSFEDLNRIDFNNYSRIRARKYYQRGFFDNNPVFWIELRSIYGNECSKKRFSIKHNLLKKFIENKLEIKSDIAKEIIKIKKDKDVNPIVAIDYLRKAFYSPDKKIRVTIDTDLCYYSYNKKNKNYFNKLLGKDSVAIVKIKSEKKLPIEIKKLTKLLSKKPLSKLQRALYFLEKSK